MKSIIIPLLLLFCISVHAQEHPPINLTLTTIVMESTNTITHFNGTEKGSFVLQLHADGTYNELNNMGPGLPPVKEGGKYVLTGNKLQLTTNKGEVRVDIIQQIDKYVTKMNEEYRLLYFTRSPGS